MIYTPVTCQLLAQIFSPLFLQISILVNFYNDKNYYQLLVSENKEKT